MSRSFIPGFDPKWRDASDYILGITKEIWEDRKIHTLHHTYGPDLIVRSPASVVVGNKGIIAATQSTLAEFPNRELLGEDVMVCPTETDSFLSSHRLLCTATHTHPGQYGAPTGRRLAYRILADCWCQNDAVHDEWLVRDQGAIVVQMGADIADWTRDLIAREGGPENCVKPMTPANDVQGPYQDHGNDDEWGQTAADVVTTMMEDGFSKVPDAYDRAATLHYPAHETAHNWGGVEQFWMGLRTAFSSAEFKVEHQFGCDDSLMPTRAALRWSLHGTHDGFGRFGPPTGAQVYVMGITHFEFGPRGIRREWTLIDDTAIWKQILLHQGSI